MTDEYLDSGLLRISEAAKRLGVGPNTVYNWIYKNSITYYEVMNKYRIPVKAVDDMLKGSIHLAKGKFS